VLPDDWDSICAAQGISAGVTKVRLVRDTGSAEEAGTALRIDRVDAGDAARWASVLVRGFGMPEAGLVEMLAATVGRPGFAAYAAWDRDEIVAAGNMYVFNGVAGMFGAATLPSHRGRGAQSGLLARRLQDASAAGCHLAIAETGKPGPGQENSSLNNMQRAGFTIRYERVSWIWRP